MRRFVFVVAPLCLLLLLLAAVAQAAPKPTFDQAIDHLFAQGYPQAVDNHLFTMPGTNPQLGFSWAGTWADNARASYLAGQMRSIGLKNVHFERVPVDVFDFKSASVKVGGKTMTASSFSGIRPTSCMGLTAPVVYAHDGTAQDFDALQAAGVSVAGKLVMVDFNPNMWWLNYPAAEATSRGAIGLVMTWSQASTFPWYSVATDALGSNDGEYDLSYAPMVYISQKDGDWLKGQLDTRGAGRVATMKLIETVRLATQGGFGYNVFGDLPGKVHDGTFVLFGTHHDVHFHAADDDSSCVADNLAIAKAMVISGYRPAHTVRFMITTGEEFGYTNSWYDWSIGAWWSITHTHPDWAGKIRVFLNSDYFTGTAPLGAATTPEMTTLLNNEAAAHSALLPHGTDFKTPVNTWDDAWTFSSAGVPTIGFDEEPGNEANGTYHTDYMRPDLIDWPYVADISKFLFRVETACNGGLSPYDLEARANDFSSTVVPADLLSAGASTAAVHRLQHAIACFQAVTTAYQGRAPSIPAGHYATVDRRLRHIEKRINSSFTALTAWDFGCYPHQQVLNDVQSLEQAIAALQAKPADTATALDALSNVALTGYGLMLSHSVYLHDLTRRQPSYSRVDWGGQGHLIHYLDVTPQYNAIEAGTWGAGTVAQLQAMCHKDLCDLNSRLNAMSATLKAVTPQIKALH